MSGISANGDKETKRGGTAIRREKAERIVLVERDRAIVRWTYAVGFTTREQVQTLLFGPAGRSHCQRRLTLLYRNRYLDKLPGRLVYAPDVYYLSRKSFRGLRLLRADGADEPLRLPRPNGLRLRHDLEIVTCRARIARACLEEGLLPAAVAG